MSPCCLPSTKAIAVSLFVIGSTSSSLLLIFFHYKSSFLQQYRRQQKYQNYKEVPRYIQANTTTDYSKKRSTAVIHMGIHKTGSSSIQIFSQKNAELLMSDGYFMPWKEQKDQKNGFKEHLNGMRLNANHVNFATCFASLKNEERTIYPCDPDLLLNGLAIAKRNENLLVSAETFWTIKAKGMESLANYLSSWDDVIIIIYYRYFHDWFASKFNQQVKGRTLNDKEKWGAENFAVVMENMANHYQDRFVFDFASEIRKYFGDVRVMNYHDKFHGGSVESFFCHVLPNATKTCNAYLAAKKNTTTINSSVSLYFSELAYAARKAGLVNVSNDSEMKELAQAVEGHAKSLNTTSNDFKKKCLSSEVLERIWAISLKNEVALFPERNATEELRADFEKAAATVLCTIDAEAILDEQNWKSFFLLPFEQRRHKYGERK